MAARVAGGDRPAACRHPRCAWFRRGAPDAGRSPGSSVEAWGRHTFPLAWERTVASFDGPHWPTVAGAAPARPQGLRPATWPASRFTRRAGNRAADTCSG